MQPKEKSSESGIYQTGCAGRIRQYRERTDGRLNIMLTGLCRYRIVNELPARNGYRIARIDWSGFDNDYNTEDVDSRLVISFKAILRQYFGRHNMQVNWKVLDKLHIEQIVNNLVLIINLDINSKQRLLESPTVAQRLTLFSELLEGKAAPILASTAESKLVS